jgi:hydrogenase-1 operon protein HyaF
VSNDSKPGLRGIPIEIEHSSGNIAPLLHEIRHALALLLHESTPTCIDLNGIPMAPGEDARIIATLGTGEVSAYISGLGKSEIAETGFPGVWLVTHFDEQAKPRARFIDVTWVPDLLRSQHADVSEGLTRLGALLDSG